MNKLSNSYFLEEKTFHFLLTGKIELLQYKNDKIWFV